MQTFAPAGASLYRWLDHNDRGRDLVVGDVHGHFATLRQALAELEVGKHDRVFSLGDLVDRGPDSFDAKDWIAGPEPSTRFDLVLRGNHEQMMLEALLEGPPRRRRMGDENAWSLWEMNGGGWWNARKPESQRAVLDRRPLQAAFLCTGRNQVRTSRPRARVPPSTIGGRTSSTRSGTTATQATSHAPGRSGAGSATGTFSARSERPGMSTWGRSRVCDAY